MEEGPSYRAQTLIDLCHGQGNQQEVGTRSPVQNDIVTSNNSDYRTNDAPREEYQVVMRQSDDCRH
jgi:hypothetical protein